MGHHITHLAHFGRGGPVTVPHTASSNAFTVKLAVTAHRQPNDSATATTTIVGRK